MGKKQGQELKGRRGKDAPQTHESYERVLGLSSRGWVGKGGGGVEPHERVVVSLSSKGCVAGGGLIHMSVFSACVRE